MAKRGNNKQHKPPKPEAADDEHQPFLRAISKKIRNINKKITQISELEHKKNLKPEQIQKVNRKPQLIQDREKLEKDLDMFRQVLEDNRDHYRNIQLKELENLAQAITIFLAFPQFEGHKRLNPLWEALNGVNGDNLSSAVENLSNEFKNLANDRKLQKSLKNFVSENATAPIKEQQIIQVAETSQQKVEVHTDEVIVYHQETVNEKGQKEEIQVTEKIHDGVVEEVTVEVVHEKSELEEEQNRSPPPIPADIPKREEPLQQNKGSDERPRTKRNSRPYRNNNRENRENRDQNNRDHKDYRERKGEGRRNYREGDNKKQYRPKYQEKNTKRVQNDSSSEQEQESRTFNKIQIKKLEEEGFTVVGKPSANQKKKQNYNPTKQHMKNNHQ